MGQCAFRQSSESQLSTTFDDPHDRSIAHKTYRSIYYTPNIFTRIIHLSINTTPTCFCVWVLVIVTFVKDSLDWICSFPTGIVIC